ncbi:MAG: hypothetical protein LBF64_00530 [Oscillospiraceae bacterium]|jgi:hypothetical protein|nr:hypothetical protein [Oscillospiraceae bacterium]
MKPDSKIVELPCPPAPPSGAEPEAPARTPGNAHFLFKYVIVLMGAALFFVFLSYLSQMQRQSELGWAEAERQAEFSVSALESMEKLRERNESLTAQTARDAAQIGTLEDEIEALLREQADLAADAEARAAQQTEERSAAEAAAADAQNRERALELLWRIERLVASRRYTQARETLAAMTEAGLDAHLSDRPDALFSDGLSAREELARLTEILHP